MQKVIGVTMHRLRITRPKPTMPNVVRKNRNMFKMIKHKSSTMPSLKNLGDASYSLPIEG